MNTTQRSQPLAELEPMTSQILAMCCDHCSDWSTDTCSSRPLPKCTHVWYKSCCMFHCFVGEIKTLMIQLLRAVAHLHDNWILHRDLKASNLLLSNKGILKVSWDILNIVQKRMHTKGNFSQCIKAFYDTSCAEEFSIRLVLVIFSLKFSSRTGTV